MLITWATLSLNKEQHATYSIEVEHKASSKSTKEVVYIWRLLHKLNVYFFLSLSILLTKKLSLI